jgi:DNA-directed RNA polymerase subunit M/transcription elongation factor TFIIS
MKVICKNCNKEFEKEPCQIRKHPNHFCSRSCAGKFNMKDQRHNPPIERICKKCGSIFKSGKENKRSRILCSKCREIYDNHSKFLKSKTLKEYHNLPSIKNKHPSWRNSHIRILNRSWNKDIIKSCKICGYNKHIELCHIKPISSFPETATIGEINSLSNNVPLCPNHHWELDNGLIIL